ncbi:MAG: GNAT family N-acetyltransferase [Pseudomonadota bacterium]
MASRHAVTITYLHQSARPALPQAPHPPLPTAFLKAERPPLHFYRYLYNTVGGPYKWVTRRLMDDETLSAIIYDPNVHIYVLYAEGVPAGFAEIDARKGDDAEIRFFGLVPDYTGAGLGRYFLTQLLHAAWDLEPKRVRLETCTLDHPAALPLYQKAGFQAYDQKPGVIEWPFDDA